MSTSHVESSPAVLGLGLSESDSTALGAAFEVQSLSTWDGEAADALARSSLVATVLDAATPRLQYCLYSLRKERPNLPRFLLANPDALERIRSEIVDDPALAILTRPLPGPLPELVQAGLPRRHHRRHTAQDLFVDFRGASGCWMGPFPVADVSSGGLVFTLSAPDAQHMDELIPGSQLHQLSLVQAKETLVRGLRARTTHVTLTTKGGQSAYRIGLSVGQRPPTTTSETIDGALRIRAIFEHLAATGARCRLRWSDRTGLCRLRGAEREDSGLLWEVEWEGPGSSRPAHLEVVELVIPFQAHTWRASLPWWQPPDRPSGAVPLPHRFELLPDRSSVRHALPEGAVTLSVQFPLSDRQETVSVLDLNSSGVAMEIDPQAQVVFPGMGLPRVQLDFPERTFLFTGTVKSVRPTQSPGRVRVGVKLDNVSPEAGKSLAQLILQQRLPLIQGCERLTVEELWSFLKRVNFIYPEKEERLQGELDQVKHTLGRVLDPSCHLTDGVLVSEAGQPRGFVSMVKAYPSTWLLNHLATDTGAGGVRVSGVILKALFQLADMLPEADFFRVHWRPENPWSERMFEDFALRVRTDPAGHIDTLDYLVLPIGEAEHEGEGLPGAGPLPDGFREVPRSEQWKLERYFLCHVNPVVVRSEALTRRTLALSQLGERFARHGLRRGRRFFWLEGLEERAFVSLEDSSPGLSLSLLLNHGQLHLDPGLPAHEQPVIVKHLLRGLSGVGRQDGQDQMVVLADPEVSRLARRVVPQLARTKRYRSCTWHRSLHGVLLDHLEQVFDYGEG